MRYVPRYICFLSALMALASLVACEREIAGGQDVVEDVTASSGGLHAYIVNPEGLQVESSGVGAETRTDFDSYVGKFAWSEGDRIAIHLSDGSFYEAAVNAETGAFTCSTTESKQRDAYAIYPASARDNSNYGSPTLNIFLPAEYDIRNNLASDFSPVPMIAVNRQGEDDLYFRHVGGLLRITCDRVPADTRYIALTFDRNVAGTFTVVNPLSENPTISNGGSSATVTFRVAEDKLTQRTNGIVLNVPVPVGVISHMKVAALDASGSELRYSDREIPTLSRGCGKKLACNVIPAYTDSMQMLIHVGDENDMSFQLPIPYNSLFPADLLVDWGDGSATVFLEGSRYGSFYNHMYWHTYSELGDYTITLTTTASDPNSYRLPGFTFSHCGYYQKNMLKAIPTPILYESGVSYSMFLECEKLVSVCGDLFRNNPQLYNFDRTFAYCYSLQEIPEDLFSYTPDANSFLMTFFCCTGLKGGIPEKLFAKNPSVYSFDSTFAGCSELTGSIPEALFANNTSAKVFASVFSGCRKLTGSIPAGLFANNTEATTFEKTFWSCYGLTGSIPGLLFASCPNVTNFNQTFSACPYLTGVIPKNLFANQPNVVTFIETFSQSSRLSGISVGLFDHNPLVVDFRGVFSQCSNIRSIPSGLFRNNPLVADFSYAFRSTGIIRLPSGLFSNNHEVTTFEKTFDFCDDLVYDIPGDLFSGCTKVTSFQETFCSCKGCSGQIPASLFSDCSGVTTFRGVFKDCGMMSGTIPAGFFSNHSLAVDFSEAFYDCKHLAATADIFTNETVTPATRFASVESAVNFKSCFYNLGSALDSAGTAPPLWTFTFPDGLTPLSTGCFLSATKLTNYPDIRDDWK